jgi:hypothetical protein
MTDQLDELEGKLGKELDQKWISDIFYMREANEIKTRYHGLIEVIRDLRDTLSVYDDIPICDATGNISRMFAKETLESTDAKIQEMLNG